MLKTFAAIFVLLHGLVHLGLAAAPDPGDKASPPGSFFAAASRSWLLRRLGVDAATTRLTGWLLVAASCLGFLAAGLGMLGVPILQNGWQMLALFTSAVSLGLLIVFWHPWLVLGILIDLGIIVGIFLAR